MNVGTKHLISTYYECVMLMKITRALQGWAGVVLCRLKTETMFSNPSQIIEICLPLSMFMLSCTDKVIRLTCLLC
jgi:hypothetical protein